ncbi:MAG: hypothetical protein ACRDJO_12495, partial [Actinomycetota bacterium]
MSGPDGTTGSAAAPPGTHGSFRRRTASALLVPLTSFLLVACQNGPPLTVSVDDLEPPPVIADSPAEPAVPATAPAAEQAPAPLAPDDAAPDRAP